MKISRKLELARLSVDGIATDHGKDAQVLIAALNALKTYIDEKIEYVNETVAAEVADALAEDEED